MVKQNFMFEVVGLTKYSLVSAHFYGYTHFYVNGDEFTTVKWGYKNAGPRMLMRGI